MKTKPTKDARSIKELDVAGLRMFPLTYIRQYNLDADDDRMIAQAKDATSHSSHQRSSVEHRASLPEDTAFLL